MAAVTEGADVDVLTAISCERADWRNIPLACIQIVYNAFLVVFYIPCLIVMFRPPMINDSCYKIMCTRVKKNSQTQNLSENPKI